MSDVDALQAFLAKWRARWPEWAVAEVFVPAAQRERAQAWFALRDELGDAAWGGQDPLPGDAKLGWWAEELDGWSRGARRHPLGLALQRVQAPWDNLAACLPALRLFDSVAPAPARNVVLSLLAERAMRHPDGATPLGDLDVRGWSRGLLAQWPPPGDGTRPGRIHAAVVRGRLQRHAQGKPPALPRLGALATAWRAARG